MEVKKAQKVQEDQQMIILKMNLVGMIKLQD